MARPLRIEYSGAFYHVIQRGLEKRKIFSEDRDYEKFQSFLSSAHKSYGVNIHAYCFMPNHYHLIVETPEANIKKAMHMINTGYSVYFNKRYRRVGPLFQGRYKTTLIEADEYLDHVSRYIHLNPVKAVNKTVEKPESYKWSSYPYYTGKKKEPEWLKTDFVLGMFGGKKKNAACEYKKFVEDVMIDSKKILDENMIMGVFVGGKELFEEIKEKYIDSREDAEIPKIREIKRLDDAEKSAKIKEEVTKVIKSEKARRKMTVYLIRINTGYSLKDISALVGGITYSGISQICRRIEKRRIKDKGLNAIINKLNIKVSKVKT